MISRIRQSRWLGRGGLITACALLAGAAGLLGANSSPSSRIYVDPEAVQVELFAGMADGSLEVKLLPKDSKGGTVFFENKTGKAITVKLPDAVVGAQVLKQGFFGPQNGLNGLNGLNPNQSQSSTGQSQQIGGGMSTQGNGPGFANPQNLPGLPNGIFSIPPEKVIRMPLRSVCLEYGKSEPRQRMVYELRPVESFSDKSELREMLKMFVAGQIDQDVAQAASWHLASGLSWEELAAKTIKRPGQNPIPLFTAAQLKAARECIATATAQAREQAEGAASNKRL